MKAAMPCPSRPGPTLRAAAAYLVAAKAKNEEHCGTERDQRPRLTVAWHDLIDPVGVMLRPDI